MNAMPEQITVYSAKVGLIAFYILTLFILRTVPSLLDLFLGSSVMSALIGVQLELYPSLILED
ncbi:hypothetical protein BYT27DRAFT_7183457 [Phlegmacium glaucopus]|nr:hypothetical protein BYT27DRAFT_7183457 [Phlegmacium glaucopus]